MNEEESADWDDIVLALCKQFGYKPHEVAQLADIAWPLRLMERDWYRTISRKDPRQLSAEEARALAPYRKLKRI